MESNIILNIILCALIILGILNILGGYKEGFHGSEACAKNLLVTPLLAPPFGDFQQTNNRSGLSDPDRNTSFPSNTMSNYSQTTNNRRFWSTPCNGSIMLPEMCGGLYKKKKTVVLGQSPPPNNIGIRVNYYNSNFSSFI
tara:strand:- start:48 stop:467 length:420 start_codon:yes stop_codon:yes gene_type:complete